MNPPQKRHFRAFAKSERTGSSARQMSVILPRFKGCLNVSAANSEHSMYWLATRASRLATGFYQSPLEIPLDKFELTFDSQVRAFHVLTRHMVEMLPGTGGGRIIAISYSPSGRMGSWQPWAAMGAAKAALDALARYYAVALAQRGVTVNIVSPGATDDSVLSGLPPEIFQMIKDWHVSGWTPMRRMGTPADIGNAVAMLCSEKADFITGQTIHVDGGASVMDPVFPLPIQGIS
jgi:NAD(P)-dependent dehydrogenase (short-subunit alcohol dehydrogenase family)